MAEHESADESLAAELADLLPRLPRVKITPQTISQTIIDRWYGYETEYRQTIAGLRAELAEVRESHQLSEAQLVEVTLERAEWRKQAQQYETVAKILRADLAAANKQAKEQAAAHDHWLCYASNLESDLGTERNRVDAAERKLAESLDALTVAAELIDRLAFDDECDYDHHDYCQAHNLHERPCPHPLGRQFVTAWRAVEAEQKETADNA